MSKRYSKEDVFQALVKAHGVSNSPVHRATLAQSSEIPLQIIDDHVKTLVADARVVRRERGLIEPVAVSTPPRAVSITCLPDGRAKIELGDELVELNPRELIILARLMLGYVPQKGL